MKHHGISINIDVTHEFHVDAPETLTEDDIAALFRELANYTNDPSEKALNELLSFNDYDYCHIDASLLPEYRKVKVTWNDCYSHDYTVNNLEDD